MTKIAVVYHSGYGHTHVLAERLAEGVRAGGAEPVLLRIENAGQDMKPLIEAASAADAIVFGAPTYMGGPSAPFKVFADATAPVWYGQGWRNKLGAGFSNSGSAAGDKASTLAYFQTFAAQHGMNWINLGVTPAEQLTGLNRHGFFNVAAAQSENASPETTPPEADRLTAAYLGKRVAEAAIRWARGAA
jgi:NAD(P)H dehydrogenase (quinone)